MNETETKQNPDLKTIKAILVLTLLLLIFSAADSRFASDNTNNNTAESDSGTSQNITGVIIPSDGVVLPIAWRDLGKRMIESGVIDQEKFEALYSSRGGFTDEQRGLLYESNNDQIVINQENSGFLLNLLWAFGLSNKNSILEDGEMTNARYGGDAGKFAATGGWTLSSGHPMGHYSKHQFVKLTPEEQLQVENVSKGIYRPCCGNSTHFPDCNHGMAMLGLLQLLASEGLNESDMYDIALSVNSYWFPDTYMTLAKYFEMKGVAWADVNPKDVLSANYSSSQGYSRVLQEIEPSPGQSGGGCSA